MRHLMVALLALALTGCGVDAGVATTSNSPPTESTIGITTPTPLAMSTASTIPTEPGQPTDISTRSITVGGMGAEYAAPVRCIVDIGVSSRRPTVAQSSRAAAEAGQAMTDTLTAAGVALSDIQTSDFSVGPFYEEWPKISGYETRIGYRVTIPDLTGIGATLASAIEAGGDDATAWGIRFEADPEPLMEAARAQAWADVVTRAESLVDLAGVPLGDVLDIHEKVLLTSSHGMMQGGEGDSASFDIPVSPGVSGVVILLTVTFAIGD